MRFSLAAFAAASLLTAGVVTCSGDTSKGDAPATGGSSTGGSSSGGSSSGGSSGSTTGGSSGVGGSAGTTSDASSGGSAGADAGVCAEGGASDASSESAIATSCSVAVLKVTRVDSECSGAGGEHLTFDVIEIGRGPKITKISQGDHAFYPPPGAPSKVGQFAVAGIDPFGKLVPRPDNSGWCLQGLPSVDGYAHTAILVKDAVEGSAKMKQILSGK